MKMTGKFFLCLCQHACLGALLSAAPAFAQTPAAPAAVAPAPADAAKSPWAQLTRPQQVALAPLAAEWDEMDAPRRQKWLEIANRYASMKADEQQRVHDRMREWVKLSPQERRLVRENYALSKTMGKSERTAQWEQYQALPEEEKRKLAAEAALKKQATQPAKNPPPTAVPNAK